MHLEVDNEVLWVVCGVVSIEDPEVPDHFVLHSIVDDLLHFLVLESSGGFSSS